MLLSLLCCPASLHMPVEIPHALLLTLLLPAHNHCVYHDYVQTCVCLRFSGTAHSKYVLVKSYSNISKLALNISCHLLRKYEKSSLLCSNSLSRHLYNLSFCTTRGHSPINSPMAFCSYHNLCNRHSLPGSINLYAVRIFNECSLICNSWTCCLSLVVLSLTLFLQFFSSDYRHFHMW